MSIVLKTIRDRGISSKFWTLWVVGTLDIVPMKYFLSFPQTDRHLELCQKWKMLIISKTVRDRVILIKF